MEQDKELADLAERLARRILAGLGMRSRWAMRAALDAAETEGVAGLLVLNVPPKCKDHVDATFTVGTVDVITRWGGH